MGLINIYNTVSNESREINANGILKDILPDYNFNNCVMLKAGEKINSHYEVRPDDVLYIRVTPRGVTAAVIAITSVVVLAGAAMGAALYNKTQKLKEEQEKAQRNAQNLAQQIEQLPFLKGAKNRGALGNGIQYQLGRVYNTPYLLTDGFYTISGDLGKNQYYNAVMSLGYGNQKIESVSIGDSLILKNNSGITSGVHHFNSDSVYYDPENIIEIRQAGEEFTTEEFKYKVIKTDDGAELVHEFGDPTDPADPDANGGTPLIRQVADYTKKLEVCIQFNGLRSYNAEAESWKPREATVRPYWSNDDGATWHEFFFSGMNNNTINVNSKNTIRFVATKEFTAGEVYGKKILLKVVKTTPKAESNTNESCYLAYYQSYCFDAGTSSAQELKPCKVIEAEFENKITRIAVRIKANDNTNGQLDNIHAITSALAPIWDGEKWTTEKQATSNPAAEILEIMTSEAHKFSKIGRDEIDLQSLGALYDYCELNGFTCNHIITSGIKKLDIISNILNTVNASMYINADGLYSFVIDKAESLPVALLNAENIKSISYAKDFKRKPDGVKVTYTNGESWQVDTFYSMIRGGERTQDDITTELNLEYVTEYEHAYKAAQRYNRAIVLQPRSFTVSVGRCGDYYPLYSLVLLQTKEFRQGLKSSTITGFTLDAENNINGLKISDYINFIEGKRYGVIIYAVTPYGNNIIYKEIEGAGLTREFSLTSSISEGVAPQLFNSVSIGYLDENGEFETIINKMKIYGIKAEENGYSLTLKDYNPALYEYGTIPPYVSNITRPPVEAQTIPAPNYQEIKGKAGQQGASAFNYLGVFNNYNELPASNNGDFFLCGNTFTVTEELAVNGDPLEVNGDNLGVKKLYEKGVIYYSNSRGNWLKVENKNNYRYIVAANDLELLGEAISPALNAATVGRVYEETGLDSLEDKEIIDQETKTIKADLIDADTIKGRAGFFDNIKSENSEFVNSQITGKFTSIRGIYFNNYFEWPGTAAKIPELFQKLEGLFSDGVTTNLHCKGYVSFMSDSASGGYFRFIELNFNTLRANNGTLIVSGIGTDTQSSLTIKTVEIHLYKEAWTGAPNGFYIILNGSSSKITSGFNNNIRLEFYY